MTATDVDHARFWAIVDAARGDAAALTRDLATLPAADIAGFDAWFWAYYLATSRQDLWAAVSAIRGGCGDDSFDYFRGWLIGRGEAAVLAAIRDPESLAELIGDVDPCDEAMLGAARHAYRDAGHGELPSDGPRVDIPELAAWPADRFASGQTWDAAFYRANYPNLYATHVARRPRAKPLPSIARAEFWAIVAAATTGSASADDAEARLDAELHALSRDALIGFERWLHAYFDALGRADTRIVCGELLGVDDRAAVAGFRGWVILQGEATVHALIHDPRTLATVATHPPAARPAMRSITLRARTRYGITGGFAAEVIPDLDGWPADGRHDPAKLTAGERAELATARAAAARATRDPRARLALLDEAQRFAPQRHDIRGLRALAHAELGDAAAARADLDAVVAQWPDRLGWRWERAKLRLAAGDRAGALADATAAAREVDAARAWLSTQTAGAPARVRHPKFGDGTVVSADTSGSEPKLVIDFASGRKTIARRFVEPIE